jgi:hypothetical protein
MVLLRTDFYPALSPDPKARDRNSLAYRGPRYLVFRHANCDRRVDTHGAVSRSRPILGEIGTYRRRTYYV